MKVAKEVAITEIDQWLQHKKINDKKREAYKDNIEALIDAVCEGNLVLDPDTKDLKQTLMFPLEGEKPLSVLTYKPRLKVSTVHMHLQGVKSSDGDGRVCAYIAALTSTPKEVVKALDTEDYSTGQNIAVFFL